MCSCSEGLVGESGQATVEAAFVIPVVFLLLIMLCQPLIILYDRMVMENAAAETCRALMTRPESGVPDEVFEDYARRRLGSIPPLEVFHVHEGGCSYQIELSGSEASGSVSVSISNRLRLLPLIGLGAQLLGRADASRAITQRVEVTLPSRPSWATGSPDDWRSRWD